MHIERAIKVIKQLAEYHAECSLETDEPLLNQGVTDAQLDYIIEEINDEFDTFVDIDSCCYTSATIESLAELAIQ